MYCDGHSIHFKLDQDPLEIALKERENELSLTHQIRSVHNGLKRLL